MRVPRNRRLGTAFVVIGLVTIVGAVLWILEVANGPGTGPKRFAERRSYNQVKEALHESFPLGFAVGVAGLGLAMLGGRMRGSSDGQEAESAGEP